MAKTFYIALIFLRVLLSLSHYLSVCLSLSLHSYFGQLISWISQKANSCNILWVIVRMRNSFVFDQTSINVDVIWMKTSWFYSFNTYGGIPNLQQLQHQPVSFFTFLAFKRFTKKKGLPFILSILFFKTKIFLSNSSKKIHFSISQIQDLCLFEKNKYSCQRHSSKNWLSSSQIFFVVFSEKWQTHKLKM